MSQVFNTNVESQSQKGSVHLLRKAEVIFIKKAKLLVDAGYSGAGQAVEATNRFQEFLDSGVLKESLSLESRDENPDKPSDPRHIYWTVTTSSLGAVSKVGGTTQLLPNADVEYVTTTTSASSPGTASITLRNPLEKYTVKKNPMYLGQSVFESDDLVYVNLPGRDGKLRRRFTGLITTVSMTARASDTGYDHIIQIECSDMLKRLWESRSNVRPSFISSEAQGAKLSIFTNTLADLLPHEILAKLFVRSYSDIYSIAGARSQLSTFRGQDPETGATNEENYLKQFDKVPSSGTTSSPFLSADGTIVVTGGTAQTPTSNVTTTQDVAKEIPKRIYGFRQAPKTKFTDTERIFQGDLAVLTYGGNHPVDDLAFIIEGTTQLAYQKSFDQYGLSHFNSEWKSSYDIAKYLAETLNFELNTTAEGIVRFRAFNNLLPADIKQQQPTAFTPDVTKTRVGYEYWLQKPYIISETLTDTDDGVVTIMQVVGQWDYSNIDATGIQKMLIGRAVDAEKLATLGARPGPQLTKIELLTQDACEAAAAASLIRLNAHRRSGSVVYVGDSSIKPGNPCYLPHRNRVYYIDTIQDDFRPGSSYTMNLTLKYGRVPVAITAEKAAELSKSIAKADPSLNSLVTSNYVFPSAIFKRKADGLLDPTTKQPMVEDTDEQRYILHGPTGDGNLVFNGYIWEDLPTCTYEELRQDYQIANTAQALGRGQQEVRHDGQIVKDAMQTTTPRNIAPDQAKNVAVKNYTSKVKSSSGSNPPW